MADGRCNEKACVYPLGDIGHAARMHLCNVHYRWMVDCGLIRFGRKKGEQRHLRHCRYCHREFITRYKDKVFCCSRRCGAYMRWTVEAKLPSAETLFNFWVAGEDITAMAERYDVRRSAIISKLFRAGISIKCLAHLRPPRHCKIEGCLESVHRNSRMCYRHFREHNVVWQRAYRRRAQ